MRRASELLSIALGKSSQRKQMVLSIIPGQVKNVKVYNSSTGSIFASTVTGGSSPLTYKWGDGPTSSTRDLLAAGSYVLTVTDGNGQTVAHTFVVTQNEPIQMSTPGTVTSSFSDENTGTIGPAVISGGSSQYMFAWADTKDVTTSYRSNLGAGHYRLIVTDSDNSSQLVHEYTVLEYIPLAITCAGHVVHVAKQGESTGSISALQVEGGNSVYTYRWADEESIRTPDRSDLSTGYYQCVVSDSMGSDTVEITYHVKENTEIQVVAGRVYNTSSGDALAGSIGQPQMSGGDGFYTYSWADNVAVTTCTRTGITAGEYVLTINDSSGNVPAQVTYVVSDFDTISITPGEVKQAVSGAATGIIEASTINGGSQSFEYTWEDVNGTIYITSRRLNLTYGTYTLTVHDKVSNEQVSHTFNVKQEKRRAHARVRKPM